MNACTLAEMMLAMRWCVNECAWSSNGKRAASVYTECGTGERRRFAHFAGEDQDIWCSAPFD